MDKQQNGGKIEAHSQPGGNVISVRLPFKPERQAATNSADSDFLRRALLNDNLWGKLMAGS